MPPPSPIRFARSRYANNSNNDYSNAEEVDVNAVVEEVKRYGIGDRHAPLSRQFPLKHPRTPTKKYPALPPSPPPTPKKASRNNRGRTAKSAHRRQTLKHKASGGSRSRRR